MESQEVLNRQNSIGFSSPNTPKNIKLFASKYFIDSLKKKQKTSDRMNEMKHKSYI